MDALPGSLTEAFEVPGRLVEAEPLGSGHIHATYVASLQPPAERRRVLIQRLNTAIFSDPERLMENLIRVTDHLRRRLAERRVDDLDRRCLRVIPTREGRPLHVAPDGAYWRAFAFIEGARSYDVAASPRQAHAAARAFGSFDELLSDFPEPSPAVTIPHFHDLAARQRALEASALADSHRRVARVEAELTAARDAYEQVSQLLDASGADDLPQRVVHNDCKLNNVLLDDQSGEGICVIDLDTVMVGTVLSDFGELVRSASCRAPEDARDPSTVGFDLALFRALARGYLEGVAGMLTEPELNALPAAGAALSLENGIRFLTDHLSGDVYFRATRENQNLERCRAQLTLVERQLEQLDAMRRELTEAASERS